MGLLSLFMLLLLPGVALSQQRISMDVTSKQVYNKKVMRTERHIYYNSNGNTVIHYVFPQEYYVTSNRIGELSVYQPDANEVMILYEKDAIQQMETFLFFTSSDYTDLNLTKMGFVRKELKKENGRVVATYVPAGLDNKLYSKVTVVLSDKKPIYSAFYDTAGKLLKKVYYSNYTDQVSVTFPTRITEISYNAAGDSIVRREEYTNIRTTNFPKDAKFDYVIPVSARRVSPFDVKK